MMGTLGRVSENATALGAAGVELARAELDALTAELKISASGALRIVFLVLLGLFLLFWAIAALVFSGIEAAALWLPRWASALIAFGVLILICSALLLVVRRRWKRLETPAAIVGRRWGDHRRWWQQKIVERDR